MIIPTECWCTSDSLTVRVSVSQKERRCPRGKLLYCACSSRTWHTAAAFVYLSSEDHQQVITFLYLTEQNKTNELRAPEFGFEDVDLWVGIIKGVCRGGGERWFCDCSCNLQFLDELGNADTTQSVRWISWNIWRQKSCSCIYCQSWISSAVYSKRAMTDQSSGVNF